MHLRIDQRYVHISTIEGFIRPMGLSQVVVVGREIARDGLKQMLMKMAAEPFFKVQFFESAMMIPLEYHQSAFWVCGSIEEAEEILNAVECIDEVSVCPALKGAFEASGHGFNWHKKGIAVSFFSKFHK